MTRGLQWISIVRGSDGGYTAELGRFDLVVDRHRSGWDGGFNGKRALGCPFKTIDEAKAAAIAMARKELNAALRMLKDEARK